MAKRIEDLIDDPLVVIVNPADDTSVEALEAWIADDRERRRGLDRASCIGRRTDR